MKTIEEKAIEIAKLVQDGKGRDVVLIDVSSISSWTDYFVIATVTSSAHLQGLSKDIKYYIKDKLKSGRKPVFLSIKTKNHIEF